jgi:integrase
MGLYRRKDSDIWWMCFVAGGRQYRRSTETTDKRLAEKVLAKVQTQVVEGRWFEIDEAKTRTFDEMMEVYFTKISDKPSTLERKKGAFPHLREFFTGRMIDSITSDLVDDYKKRRRDRDSAADSTILNEVRLLSHAFNTVKWARENPVRGAKRIRLKSGEIDRWLTPEEEQALMPKTGGKLYGALTDIVVFGLNTGMSQEEILKLQWQQVDLFRKTLDTGRAKTDRQGLNVRTIPLNVTVYTLLKERAKENGMSGYVFRDENGGRIEADKLKKEFKKAVKESGIAHFRFHDIRHTFATRLVQAGIDLYKVSKLLGHRDVSTTQRYAHHYPESLRDGVEILDKMTREKARMPQ